MKKIKKTIAFILTIALIVCCIPLSVFADYYPACSPDEQSIVDGLTSVNADASFASRRRIAEANDVDDFEGTESQNIYLLNLLKSSRLVIPGTEETEYYTPSYEPCYGSAAVLTGNYSASSDMIEAVKDTYLRSGPGKDYDKLCTVTSGDCFRVVDETTNRYGNVWYRVSWAEQEEAYIYSGNVRTHEHSFNKIADNISICKCGSMATAGMNTVTAEALALSTLGVDYAVAALAAAGATITTAATVALPFVVIVTFAGTVIYMEVTLSGSQVIDASTVSTKEDVQKIEEKGGYGSYYRACVPPRCDKGIIVFDLYNGMDIYEAHDYLLNASSNPASIAHYALNNEPIVSVYTIDAGDALELAELWDSWGSRYDYGDSTGTNHKAEIDGMRSGNPKAGYFYHYHLYHVPVFSFILQKFDRAHLWFGFPYEGATA